MLVDVEEDRGKCLLMSNRVGVNACTCNRIGEMSGRIGINASRCRAGKILVDVEQGRGKCL